MGVYSAKDLADAAEDLQKAFEANNEKKYEKALDNLNKNLPGRTEDLNSIAWDWVDEEEKLPEPARILAKKAYEKDAKPHILDTLAYAEIFCGRPDESVEHFRQAIDEGSKDSTFRLAYALAVRGMPGDATESCGLLIDGLQVGAPDKYAKEAIQEFLLERHQECPELAEELQQILNRPQKNWTELPWVEDLPSALKASSKEERPVLLYYSEEPGEDLFSDPVIWGTVKEHFVLYKPESDQLSRVRESNGYGSYDAPVLSILNSEGREIWQHNGREPGKFFWEFLTFFDQRKNRIEKWHIAAPFPNKDGSAFDEVFPPEKKVELTAEYSVGDATIGWEEAAPLDFMTILTKWISSWTPSIGYAYARIESPREQAGSLRITRHEGVKVWFNGELVSVREYPYMRSDSEVIPVELKSGTNELLLKIKNRSNWISFSATITGEDGEALN